MCIRDSLCADASASASVLVPALASGLDCRSTLSHREDARHHPVRPIRGHCGRTAPGELANTTE
eukprot:9044186-Alexandrium_andersonii.AAC.1